MAKAAKAICERCEHRIAAGSPFCDRCGQPTLWANHEDRVRWELAVYREKAEKNPMGVLYEPSTVQTAVSDSAKPSRKPRLFGRKAQRVPNVVAQPKPATPEPAAAPVLRAVEPAPVRELPPTPKVVARPPHSKADKEPLRDTPATVLALRMLNARVAELDAMIQKLQHEIEILRRS
jgi:hypothetical protein